MLLTYIGPSMLPTFKPGDLMDVIPYETSRMRVGDVVVFVPVGWEHNIVHRVVSIAPEGIRTKGDNNNKVDSFVLSAGDIIGRVVSIRRGNRQSSIRGGARGRIAAQMLRARKRADLAISRACQPVYRRLARTGIFRKTLSRWIKTHVICFRRRDGIEMQLFMGRRIIGRCCPGRTDWHIRRPFRLFVNELSLPSKTV